MTNNPTYEYEWRITHSLPTTGGGYEREGFGLDEKGARETFERYKNNTDVTELKLWKRPKPEKWEEVE